MRNKILIITAMLAVMVTMTGIAAAYDGHLMDADGLVVIGPSPITIPVGIEQIYSYQGVELPEPNTGFPYDLTYDDVHITPHGAGAVASDITVTTPEFFHVTGATTTDVGAIHITLETYRVGATYDVVIGAGGELVIGTLTLGESDSDSRSFTGQIPEFPTVALPIAAVIGLVFFFQNKKNKKE